MKPFRWWMYLVAPITPLLFMLLAIAALLMAIAAVFVRMTGKLFSAQTPQWTKDIFS